jgi:hypothetical protein
MKKGILDDFKDWYEPLSTERKPRIVRTGYHGKTTHYVLGHRVRTKPWSLRTIITRIFK